MSKIIVLQPHEVWMQHLRSIAEPSSMLEIASCVEYGISVYLCQDEQGCPSIAVEADGGMVFAEDIFTADDCQRTVEKVYDTYLTDKAVGALQDFYGLCGDISQLDQEDAIAQQEEELDTLVYEFVIGVLGGVVYIDNNGMDAILSDIKEHFLEYMARKHNLPIFRPMMLEDDEGMFYEEYPYECMDFSDKDNPIYE